MMTAQQSVGDVGALPRPHAASDQRGEYVPFSAQVKEEAVSHDSAQPSVGDVGALPAASSQRSEYVPYGEQVKEEAANRSSAGEQDAVAVKHADDEENKKVEVAPKKSRRELPPHTVAILKGWMMAPENVKHPYPTDDDKQMLLKKTGITMKQLTNWFTNARKRIWKPMRDRARAQEIQSGATEFATTLPRDMFPGAVPIGYVDGAFGPRAISHSFDAGSLGPPRDPQLPYDPYARHFVPGVAGGVARYPSSIFSGAPMYPPRAIRSMSEAPARSETEECMSEMHNRKRLHDRDDSPDDYEHSSKRMRTSLAPRGLKVLQDWVNARAHTEYPFPNDSERVQLSRETGLDIGQLDAWIKSLHDHAIGASTAPSPSQTGRYGPPAGVDIGTDGTSVPLRSIPSRDNSQLPPPSSASGTVYGVARRSIPSAGNSLFPPRPTSTMRSVPGAGNPQYPPPPSMRRQGSDSERGNGYYPPGGNGGYPAPSAAYPASSSEALRANRSLSISSGQYLRPPPPTPTGQHVPPAAAPQGGSLPSLSSRNLLNRTVTTPTMGQPRDSRSHTLDMSQFTDARRRRMNFQDILASTKASGVPEPSAGMQSGNAENVYPNRTLAPYPPVGFDSQQQKNGPPAGSASECQRCDQGVSACGCNERASTESGPAGIV